MLRANKQIGPYTLIKQLGKGSFGVVWLAEKRTPIATSQVAIKIALDEEPDMEAIKQEASLWIQIGGHPNVLPIIEANIYNGQVIIVVEYAPDGSLENWMKKNNGSAPSIELAVSITSGILSGLEHLHSKKVLHRDLKPANILLQGEAPRLADFGLSRILKTTAQSTNVAGTPAYMSPEAFDGKKIVPTDIWAVGVIFYQLLTGNFPFPAKEYSGLIGAIFTKNPEPLPKNLKQFQHVITKALEKKPEMRYQSAREMKEALQSCLMKATAPLSILPISKNESKDRLEEVLPKEKFLEEERKGKAESQVLTRVIAVILVTVVLMIAGTCVGYINSVNINSINGEKGQKEVTPINMDNSTPSPTPTQNVGSIPLLDKQQAFNTIQKLQSKLDNLGHDALNLPKSATQNEVIRSLRTASDTLEALKRSVDNDVIKAKDFDKQNQSLLKALNKIEEKMKEASKPQPIQQSGMTVKLQLLSQGAMHFSPLDGLEVILSTENNNFKSKTDQDGYVVFYNIPCGNQISITSPDFQLQNGKTWIVKRKFECGEPSITIGSYGDLSGSQLSEEDKQYIIK